MGDESDAPKVTTTTRTPDADDRSQQGGDPSIAVSGGANGISARYDDLERLGDLYRALGSDLVGAAWDDKLEAADGDLLLSSVLSPGTFARAEEAILGATYGPRGLVTRAVSIEAQALTFTAVAEFYQFADEARRQAIDALAYAGGFALGFALPGLAIAGVGGLAALAVTNPLLAAALVKAGIDSQDELIAYLEDHPELIEGLINGGGGLLDGLSVNPISGPFMDLLGLDGFHPDTGSAADDLGELLFGDYHGELNPDYDGPLFAHEPPRSLEDIIEDLGSTAAGDVPSGVITIQTITDADGNVSHVVQLPGTDDFVSETEIRNMGSNLNLIAGDDTAYAEAIRDAMVAAGVDPSDPVMLVGHSQGGMQAAALAGDPDFGYNVTHVVTAGAPVATSDIPDHVQVMSLENTGDVVPLLDGEQNPASANHTTVQADAHSGSFGAKDGQNHSLSTYESIASSADASSDASIQTTIAGMHEQGFISEEGEVVTSQTHTYQTQTGDQIRAADIRNS